MLPVTRERKGQRASVVCGPFIAGRLIEAIGAFSLLLIVGVILLLSLILTNSVDAREAGEVIGRQEEDGREGSGSD